MPARHRTTAFTLIELSIVLVIIGLLVGGVLVGRDLISAARIRSQISQIEKYQTAVNTFRVKYNYLPGDIPEPHASSLGFIARGSSPGQGDGNGIIQGNDGATSSGGGLEAIGETTVFWADLSSAKLIDGNFTMASATSPSGVTLTPSSTPSFSAYFPKAKLERDNYLYVWSGGMSGTDSKNYFGLSKWTTIQQGGSAYSSPAISVQEAYNIDKKIDDGMPQYGTATATYISDNAVPPVLWAAGGGNSGASTAPNAGLPTTAATPYATTNCYDNNNVVGVQTYSLRNADILNCALSFRFQ